MTTQAGYQVLARKYRPETFADLVGQGAMVRTLENAFAAGRIAQAFVMTGIRGTGKTTTARIIAKGLNCTGPDGMGSPTITPCGVCEPCREIMEGRHVDVIEIDAASHTGVQNIRDTIIETVSYRATSARYKVFIIDEVHMLSSGAFNALLKTLEEPPAHVKFILATTEIHKVPVTVLSRCQRFDLRRIEPEDMIAMLRRIAASEGALISDAALALITRAAEGSARDATSLLDQAISHGGEAETDADAVRALLGLSDRARVMDLFDHVMSGRAREALEELGAQYAMGADPVAVLREFAEVTHWISLVKIAPDATDDPTVSPDEKARGEGFAARLSIPVLTRTWQMILKAIDEVSQAPNAMMAAEMALIRLTHVADLPPPERLIRELANAPPPAKATPTPPTSNHTPPSGSTSRARTGSLAPNHAPEVDPLRALGRFEDVVALIRERRDMALLLDVENAVRLVSYSPGRISFEPGPDAPADLASRLAQRLGAWTGARWGVSIEAAGGAESIGERRAKERRMREDEAASHPLVAAAFLAFPNARIIEITSAQEAETNAASAALPELDEEADGSDDWDPFEG